MGKMGGVVESKGMIKNMKINNKTVMVNFNKIENFVTSNKNINISKDVD